MHVPEVRGKLHGGAAALVPPCDPHLAPDAPRIRYFVAFPFQWESVILAHRDVAGGSPPSVPAHRLFLRTRPDVLFLRPLNLSEVDRLMAVGGVRAWVPCNVTGAGAQVPNSGTPLHAAGWLLLAGVVTEDLLMQEPALRALQTCEAAAATKWWTTC